MSKSSQITLSQGNHYQDKSVSCLKNWIQQTQPNIHSDEIPWAVKGVKEWLWIFASTDFALFHAVDTRSRAELENILGLKYWSLD